MLKKALAVVAILGLIAVPALALEAQGSKTDAAAPQISGADQIKLAEQATKTASSANLGLALAFALGVAALGGAFSQSNAIAKAVDAVARQPEAGARIQGMMIIGLALIETLVIYVLLICFVWGGRIG
jgi:F-type H+-transporting ATPase subunit c